MKRFLCTLLAAMMLLSLVACGGNTTNNTNNTQNPSGNTSGGDTGNEENTEVREVLMGINSSQPPASFVNEDGSIGGQNYEVMVKVDELLPQ